MVPDRRDLRVVDLSHEVGPGMPCYPGTEPPAFERAFTVAEHGFAELRLRLLTHTGTHLDTPAHMRTGGPCLDDYPAGWFVGRAAVVDVVHAAGGTIAAAELQAHEGRLAGVDYVLLRTGWSDRWGDASYFAGYPVLSVEAARWLAGRGLKGVGVDAVSVDAGGATIYAVHEVLLGAGLIIVENLTNLRALGDRQFLFSCLPLKLAGGDGSPVRAVALLD